MPGNQHEKYALAAQVPDAKIAARFWRFRGRYVNRKHYHGNKPEMKFSHIGIPVTGKFEGEIDLPHLKMTVSDYENNPYGIQWQRYWDDAPYPELVKTVPHVAFVVQNIEAEILGKNVIIEPNSPSEGLIVAFIEVNGAPVELMEYKS